MPNSHKCNNLFMILKTCIFFIIVFMSLDCYSQSPTFFQKIIGQPGLLFENGNSVKQLPDGSYALAGVRGNVFNNVDCFVLRIDQFGNVISEIGLYDTTVSHFYQNLQLTNGGYIISGAYRTYNPLIQKHFITKTDFFGDTLWTRVISSTSLNSASYYVQNALDGGYIIGGYKVTTLFWESNLIKLDSMGNVEFDSLYNGLADDITTSIIVLLDSNYVITGGEYIAIGNGNAFLQKIDSFGNTIWKNIYHFFGDYETGSASCKIAMDNGYILGGNSGNSPLTRSPLLIKTDSLGNSQWMKKLYETPSQAFYGNIIKINTLPNGDFVGCGSMYHTLNAGYSRMALFKTDSAGELKWIRFYTPDFYHDAYAYDMDTTSDSGFIISGRRDTTNGGDIFLVKTNCLGFTNRPNADFSVIWNGNTATFYNLCDRADTCVYYFGDGDSAIVQLTDTMPVIHQYSGPGSFQAYLLAHACGKVDTLYQTITTNVDDSYNLIEKSFSIFPNPANDRVTISVLLPENINNVNLLFMDLTGRIITSHKLNENAREHEIDISFLSSGSYQVSLESKGAVLSTRKVVVIK